MGIPNLVKPELTKIDLSRLKQDFTTVLLCSPDTNTWWQSFLDDFEENYTSLSDTHPVWYLDRLKVMTQVHHNPATNVPETNNLTP